MRSRTFSICNVYLTNINYFVDNVENFLYNVVTGLLNGPDFLNNPEGNTIMNAKQTALIQDAQLSILGADFATIKDSISATLDACHKAKLFAGLTKSIEVIYVIFPTLPKGITAPKLPAPTEDYSQEELSTIRYAYQSIVVQWCRDVGIVAGVQKRAPNKNPPKASVVAAAKTNKSLTVENAPVATLASVTDTLPIGASIRAKVDAITQALKGLYKDVGHNVDGASLVSEAITLMNRIKV